MKPKNICHNCKTEQIKFKIEKPTLNSVAFLSSEMKPEKEIKKCTLCNVSFTISKKEHNELDSHQNKKLFMKSLKSLNEGQIEQIQNLVNLFI